MFYQIVTRDVSQSEKDITALLNNKEFFNSIFNKIVNFIITMMTKMILEIYNRNKTDMTDILFKLTIIVLDFF